MNLSNLISTDDAAVILGRHPNTIRAMVRRGELPQPVKINACTHRHRMEDIEALARKLQGDHDQEQGR